MVWSSDSSPVRAGWLYFPTRGGTDVVGTFYSEFHCRSKVNFITVRRIYVM